MTRMLLEIVKQPRLRAKAFAKRHPFAIFVCVSMVVSAALNWRIVFYWQPSKIMLLVDCDNLVRGYHQNPSLWQGAGHWFTGTWINGTHPAYRPLASVVHWCQVWLLLHAGGWASSLSVWLLFVACATLCGALAYAWTGSLALGSLASALAAAPPTVFHYGEWLTWFPVSDDLTCVAFYLGCLVAFSRGWKLPAAVLFALACFAKESAYSLPLALAAIAYLAPNRPRRWWVFPTLSAACVLALLFYRAHVLSGHAGVGITSLERVRSEIVGLGATDLAIAAALLCFVLYGIWGLRHCRSFVFILAMSVATMGPVFAMGYSYWIGHHLTLFYMAILPCFMAGYKYATTKPPACVNCWKPAECRFWLGVTSGPPGAH